MMRCIENAGLCDRLFISAFLIGRKGRLIDRAFSYLLRAIALQELLKQAMGEGCKKVG
ncbi:hypothetical protein [Microcoleus sp. PH2017_05_CCC_O_A]|uniref:hypothetical protein n=1 Tax=Microcoleus sp. PH2017_05_CCC_O_A TaxID=2798816 RepID=UPI001DE65AF7|nr:hypothetical protein [Microcoleus sp. PH2017_05_CCC_O_A]MCC3434250.1 hypothetical protein [Microcoleus sp. PH2017_05_CCC_O_A]